MITNEYTIATPTSDYNVDLEDASPNMRTSGRSSTLFNVVAIPPREMDDVVILGEKTPKKAYKKPKYNGRYKMWPGILLLVVATVAAVLGMLYYGKMAREEMLELKADRSIRRKRIIDGTGRGVEEDRDLDEPGNPSKYPDKQCAHVDYISKNNLIYAVSPNGTEVKLPIKGINWSGMETSHGIPYGLWDNFDNGTTVYQVVAFLARNNFNSVRLPLSVENLVKNIKPNIGFINTNSNRAIEVKTYRSLLKSIVRAMGYRGISVLLDLHTLTPRDTGELWYSDEIPETDILEAIDILGEDLCSRKYWNIVGLDLKNEPSGASWGTGTQRDWRLGAQKLGNRMLKACSKWTAHVEGITSANSITIDGRTFDYFSWWGGELRKAIEYPVEFDVPQKLVYSPHYYSPSVYPAQYFYTGGTNTGGILVDFVEREDADLLKVVNLTMNDMFGKLAHAQDGAVIMGEFGGLYGVDKHPLKTTKRVIDYTIQNLVEPSNKFGGGYVWSLNPESGYEYNPVDTLGHFQYGLLGDDWLSAHQDYIEALSAFDAMDGMKLFPCFQDDA